MADNGKKKSEKDTTKKLTKREIAFFQNLLLEKRRELLGDVNKMEGEALKLSSETSGNLSSMPIHMADIGSDNYYQEFALDLVDGERKLLKEIDLALLRIESGEYGICLGTGKPIPKTRLEAVPWTKYSVEYAKKLEEQ